ncbi:MAG: sigma-54-dependent Fis family transcriptional regulator [Bdellovibrionales bacterium]|nr:sigma-54-dependent Fis family transcriptional regulator [Bdellovibrionales bacterium]
MILTQDPKMKHIIEIAESIASSRAAVMIQGESGTGKEILAKLIHSKSQRASQRMVTINCAAIPDGLLESELFGYVRGAFTGANQDKPGKFELANNSTLLLDELGDLPLALQAKLLRVLQENEVERLGARQPVKINVRIISTTNKNIERLVKEGKFREDLYYRLNVIPMQIPSLKQRPKDISLLAQHFVEVSSLLNKKDKMQISKEAMEKLQSWVWPGNIREMENVIERAVLLSQGRTLLPEFIELPELSENAEPAFIEAGMTIMEAEKKLILKTLEFTNQNRTKAAHLLGISIRTLRNKIHEYKGDMLNE